MLHQMYSIQNSHHAVYQFDLFPLTPMEVLAPGSAHERPSALPPINMSGDFPVHLHAESPLNISPNR